MAALLSLLVSFYPARCAAEPLQPVVAPETVTVGDLLTYTVTVPLAPDETVTGPGREAKFGPWEVRGYREEPVPGAARLVYALTAFETGAREVSPVEVRLTNTRGRTRTIRTAPVRVNVASVLKPGDEQPADIVGPLTLREKPLAIALRTLLLLLVAVALVLAVWLLWRRRRRKAAEEPAEVLPADAVALRALKRLRAEALPERGETKRHYTELSEITRTYLAARYGVRTLEETTRRVVAALRKHPQAAGHAATFAALLRESDLVKFAKARPDESACYSALDLAESVVRETAAPPAPPSESPVANRPE